MERRTDGIQSPDHGTPHGVDQVAESEARPGAIGPDEGRGIPPGVDGSGGNHRARPAQPQFRDSRRTAFILASGESAAEWRRFVFRPWPVFAINDAWRLEPSACCLYAADRRWWEHHGPDVRRDFQGACYTADAWTAKQQKINAVRVEHRPGLSLEPGTLYAGGDIGNSGAQAMNLAVHLGARQLVLVGFDMHGSHFFGDHPKEVARHSAQPFDQFVKGMATMAADLDKNGIAVVNASPTSKLMYWPRRPLADLALSTRL